VIIPTAGSVRLDMMTVRKLGSAAVSAKSVGYLARMTCNCSRRPSRPTTGGRRDERHADEDGVRRRLETADWCMRMIFELFAQVLRKPVVGMDWQPAVGPGQRQRIGLAARVLRANPSPDRARRAEFESGRHMANASGWRKRALAGAPEEKQITVVDDHPDARGADGDDVDKIMNLHQGAVQAFGQPEQRSFR
jgi:ABC-type protease/lipase transport system fused ATPase/permease subunit